MRAGVLALALCLSVPAWAQDVDVPAVGGTLLSPDALCLDKAEQLQLAKRLESDKARIKALEEAPQGVPVVAVVVGLVVAVLGVGAAAAGGYAAGKAAAQPKP